MMGTHEAVSCCCLPQIIHLATYAEISMCEIGRQDVDLPPFLFVVKEE